MNRKPNTHSDLSEINFNLNDSIYQRRKHSELFHRIDFIPQLSGNLFPSSRLTHRSMLYDDVVSE